MFYQNHRRTIQTNNRSIKRHRRALTIFAIWITIAITSSYFAINREETTVPTFKQQMAVPIKSRRTRSTTNNEGVKAEDGVKIEELGPRPIFFEHLGKTTTTMEVADLAIAYDTRHINEMAERVRNETVEIGKVIRDKRFTNQALRHIDSAVAELNNQTIARNPNKRTPWGPMAFITSLLGTGLSMAALAKAQDAQNGIANLRADSQRVFQSHNVILNDHARKINELSKGQARIMDEINSMYRYSLKDKLKREIQKFTAVIKDRTVLFADVMSGHLPANIIDQNIANAASDFFKSIKHHGYETFQDLSPLELCHLPFTVGSLGSKTLTIIIHVPIFKQRDVEIMNIYRFKPTPWLIKIDDNTKMAMPSPDHQMDTVLIPITQINNVHQIQDFNDIRSCPLFRDIRLCPSTDVLRKDFTQTCVGALFTRDAKAANDLCKLEETHNQSRVMKIDDHRFRITLTAETLALVKDNRRSPARAHKMRASTYDIRIPYGGWFRTGQFIIEPRRAHTAQSLNVIGHVNHELPPTRFKPAIPFSLNDIKARKEIKAMTATENLIHRTHHIGIVSISALVLGSIAVLGIGVFTTLVLRKTFREWRDDKRRKGIPEEHEMQNH